MNTKTVRGRMIIFFSVLGLGLLTVALIWILTNNEEVELDIYNQITAFELEEVLTESTYQSDNGKIKLLSFIFIHCPDGVCPMTMMDFALIQEELKNEGLFGNEIELITITFDPVRDTTEALQNYARHFGTDPSGWRVLRGSEEEIKAVADELKYFYHLQEDGSGMHSTTMYIIDGKHQVRAYHRMSSTLESMDKERVIRDLKVLVKEKK
jgi:protein SCO1/2